MTGLNYSGNITCRHWFRHPKLEKLQATGQTLIQLANQLNGHDNVTVGLLRFAPKVSCVHCSPGENCIAQRPILPPAGCQCHSPP